MLFEHHLHLESLLVTIGFGGSSFLCTLPLTTMSGVRDAAPSGDASAPVGGGTSPEDVQAELARLRRHIVDVERTSVGRARELDETRAELLRTQAELARATAQASPQDPQDTPPHLVREGGAAQEPRPTLQRLGAVEFQSQAQGAGLSRAELDIRQGVGQMAVLQHQVGELQQQFATLVAQKGKIPEPVKFSSEKNSVSVEHWLSHFERYASDLGLPQSNWPRRAMYFLDGKALEMVEELKVTKQQEGVDLLGSWENFQMGMRDRFSPVSPEFAVRDKLDRLKQTSIVSAYWDAFRAISARAGSAPLTAPEAIHAIRKGMKESVKVATAVDPSTKKPYTNLSELVTHALIIDQVVFGARAENKEPSGAAAGESTPTGKGKGKAKATGKRLWADSPSPSGSGAPAKARRTDDGSQGPRIPQVPGVCPQLAQDRFTEHACLRCGSGEHKLADCNASEPVIPKGFMVRNKAWLDSKTNKRRG